MQPSEGTLPPLRPVPEPRVTIVTPCSLASFTTAETSWVDPGSTTTPTGPLSAAVPSKP